jgi:hypothetical protein
MTEIIDKVVIVPASDDLSDDNFIAHMNLRHSDSIGGLHSLWLINGSVTDAWRAFHDRLHASGIHHAHSHREER